MYMYASILLRFFYDLPCTRNDLKRPFLKSSLDLDEQTKIKTAKHAIIKHV